MNRSKPNTTLSFIYNTTGTPAYRTEMHMDMRRAFQRFDVSDGKTEAACFEIERAAYDLRRSTSDAAAILPINGATFGIANKKMSEAPGRLFNELVDELVAMVVNGTDFPDLALEIDPTGHPSDRLEGFGPISLEADGSVVADGNTNQPGPLYLLLDYVYYFFHFQGARKAIRADTSGLVRAVEAIAQSSPNIPRAPNGQPRVVQTLLTLADLMDVAPSTSVTEARVRPLVSEVCALLATEYAGRGWRKCW